MLEVFQEYYHTKLDIIQRRALADMNKAAIIYYNPYDDNNSEEPELRIPVEPTFLPEKYAEEVTRIMNVSNKLSTAVLMYNVNYMIANGYSEINKELYEMYLNKYFNDSKQNISLHQYVFKQEQLPAIYKAINLLGLTSETQKILSRLLQLKSINDEIDTSDIEVNGNTAMFISEKDMKERIIKNPKMFKEFDSIYDNLSDFGKAKHKYTDRIKTIENDLYDITKTEPALRDAIIIGKYTYTDSLPKFIEQELALDMHYGKLLYPIIQYMGNNNGPYYLTRKLNAQVLAVTKRDKRWSQCDYWTLDKECKYARGNYNGSKEIQLYKMEADTDSFDEADNYIAAHRDEYRYNDTIRAMVFTAKCCVLKEITKSSFKEYGNLASIIKLYNFDWEPIWNAVFENKNEW